MNLNKTKTVALTALISLCLILALSGCSAQPSAGDLKAAAAAQKLATDPTNPDLLEAALGVSVLESNRPKDAVELFRKNQTALQSRPLARTYYATALCQLAGATTVPVEQMTWVRSGLAEFDALLRDFPDNPQAYLYQTITYSNFPDILGVNKLVTDNIAKINQALSAKTWQLDPGEIRQLSLSYINLAKIYHKAEYLQAAKTQMALDHLEQDKDLQAKLASGAGDVK